MIVDADVSVPTRPLLAIECALTLLKPRILKELERGEDKWNSVCPVVFGRSVPVFNHDRKGAERVQILCLRSEEIHKRMG